MLRGMVETFGQRLKALRERAGWSQEALAQLVNNALPDGRWYQTTVGRIERNERDVKVNELVAIADVLGLPIDAVVHPMEDADFKTGDDLWDAVMHPSHLIDDRLDGPVLMRIRELDWQIEIVRERLASLASERADQYRRLSPENRPVDPDDIPIEEKD